MTSCYVLRWLRYSLLSNFYDLEPSKQCELLQAAVRQIHNLQDEVRISPQEQIALLAHVPANPGKKSLEEGLLCRLRSALRNFLPYGYVMHKKGMPPQEEDKNRKQAKILGGIFRSFFYKGAVARGEKK